MNEKDLYLFYGLPEIRDSIVYDFKITNNEGNIFIWYGGDIS
jgi:hypothetical protein